MNGWSLPQSLPVGGRQIPIRCDYRQILKIFGYLDDPGLPVFMRWRVALRLFYTEQIPAKDRQEAMERLVEFINCGQTEPAGHYGRLMDWQQDAPLIAAEVNKVAGQEVRALPFLHWWTFMAYFRAIGQGQLATVVAIRNKLQRGKPLEKWEQEFYRENRLAVDLKKRYSPEEMAQKQALEQMIK